MVDSGRHWRTVGSKGQQTGKLIMKIGENEINPFDEENAKVLGDLADKYFVIKKGFADGTLYVFDDVKKTNVNGPPTDTNFMRAFEQHYKVTFTDLETFLELRDYFDNDWNEHVANEILNDFANGGQIIKEPKDI